jgi:hypothetical protein
LSIRNDNGRGKWIDCCAFVRVAHLKCNQTTNVHIENIESNKTTWKGRKRKEKKRKRGKERKKERKIEREKERKEREERKHRTEREMNWN